MKNVIQFIETPRFLLEKRLLEETIYGTDSSSWIWLHNGAIIMPTPLKEKKDRGKARREMSEKSIFRERTISKYRFIQKKCPNLFCVKTEPSNNLKTCVLLGLKDKYGTTLDFLKYAKNIWKLSLFVGKNIYTIKLNLNLRQDAVIIFCS